MILIIYVHHYFSKSLFYKVAHNTTDRVYNIDAQTSTGNVICKYKGNDIKFIFEPTINDNEDGIHIIDFFTTYYNRNWEMNYREVIVNDNIKDVAFLSRTKKLLENKKNWCILFFRTEKIFGKCDGIDFSFVTQIENELEKIKNHFIISDNIIIKDSIKSLYPNHFFSFTNIIYQWNELVSIRWYYEYKNIFEKLNQPYDLCFSIRHHRKNRVKLINDLQNLNNKKIYLSNVDNTNGTEYSRYEKLVDVNINNNITKGNDFDDLTYIQNIGEYKYLDYLMRILPMSKMHILSETWDYKIKDYTSNYLSEKTYGFILAKIPFIPTHSYPLEIINKILDIPNHPFYNEIKLTNGNSEKFVEFVKLFMENFDKNYELCKEWINVVHDKFMEKLNNENSLLDLILNDFCDNNKLIRVQKKLL